MMAKNKSKEERRVLISSLAEDGWYPSDKEQLQTLIYSYLSNATAHIAPNIRALILPHAGFSYSGATAGFGYRILQQSQPTRIIVLGPSHRVRMPNALSVPDATHYQTPLGEIPLDLAFIDQLKRHPSVTSIPNAHKNEHSVQIHIPFIQVACPQAALVPIVAPVLSQ